MAFRERDLMRRYLRRIEDNEPDTYVQRIAESPNGIKPFDALIVRNGKATAIEFKRDTAVRVKMSRERALAFLTAHQRHFLERFKTAGGESMVCVFTRHGEMEYRL
jgi:hypothetical protein